MKLIDIYISFFFFFIKLFTRSSLDFRMKNFDLNLAI